MARRGQGVVKPHRARVSPSKHSRFCLAAPSAHSTSGNQVLGRSSNSSCQKAKMETEDGEKDLKPPPKKATTASTGDPTRVVATVLPATTVPVTNVPSKFKARKPVISWTQLGQATYPAGIGGLKYALKSSPVVLPTVEQSHVCFPFLIIAPNDGYDGTMRQHGPNRHGHASGRKLRKACNRLHVNISVTSDGWTKEKLQPLWDFVKYPNVQVSIVPSAAFNYFCLSFHWPPSWLS